MDGYEEYNINLDDLGLKGLLEKINGLRKRIPQGINDFQVDGYYEEEFFLEFEERGFDNDYFNQRIEQLPLFCDRGRLARNTRIRMEDKGMAGKITTQKAFIKANSDCKATTPHAMADRLAETDALLAEVAANIEALPERIARLIVAPLVQKINELTDKIDEIEDSRKALEQGAQENLGRAIERMGGSSASINPSGGEGEEQEEDKTPKSPKPSTSQMLIIQNALNTLKLIFPNAKDHELKGFIGQVHHAPDTDAIVFTHTKGLLSTGACTTQELQDKRLTSLLKSIATCPQKEPYNFRRKLNALIDQWLEEKKK